LTEKAGVGEALNTEESFPVSAERIFENRKDSKGTKQRFGLGILKFLKIFFLEMSNIFAIFLYFSNS